MRSVAFLGLVSVALAACGGPAAPPAFTMPPANVVVASAIVREVPVYREEIGVAVASESVDVRSQVTGPVTEVRFADGADLEAGAPLFTIDPRLFEARFAEAKARVSATNAGVVQAKAARDTVAARLASARSKREEARARTASSAALAAAAQGEVTAVEAEATRASEEARRFEQVGAGGVSQQELDRVHAAATSARARLDAARRRGEAATASAAEVAAAEKSAEEAVREAEASVAESDAKVLSAQAEIEQATAARDTAALDVEHAHVVAPIRGRAGRRMLDIGNLATPQTTLLRIQRLDPIWVEFTVPEHALSAVQASLAKKALKAEVRLPEEAESPTARTGEVTYLDDAVQTGTGTVRLRATVKNPDAHFWPGRFVKVRLLLETKSSVLVPATAAQVSAMGPFAYVVKEQNGAPTAELRIAAFGQRHGDLVVVDRGIEAGESVIVEGHMRVMPGAPVHPMAPQAPPAGPPGAPHAPPATGAMEGGGAPASAGAAPAPSSEGAMGAGSR